MAAEPRGPGRAPEGSTQVDRAMPNLDDELWVVAHVAAYLHCGRSTAYLVVARPRFPVPIEVGQVGRRHWIANEVRSWAAHRSRGASSGGATPSASRAGSRSRRV